MKKKALPLIFALATPIALASCSFGNLIGGSLGEENSQDVSSKPGSQSAGKNTFPLLDVDEIKDNIGSYSSTFKITTYDGVYDFLVKYDKTLSAGIVTREGEDYYFVRGLYDEYVVYYENDYGYGYVEDYKMDVPFRMNLLYMNLIFDITAEIQENAPFSSKKELTYAGREATQYVITDSKYIMATDTKLNIILDNQTGAVLSLNYDNINFYESTSFTPNDQNAAQAVQAMHNSLAFDFYDKDILTLVGLENLEIPVWEEKTASFSYLDDSSKDLSNMSSYTVQYYNHMEKTDEIERISRDIFNAGIKYNYDGELKTFEELYESSRSTINYTVVDTLRFNAYVTKNNVKFNVLFQGTNQSTDPGDWFVTLAIYYSLSD